MAGKVYLIGAGPGDVGLLTLRAKSILEKANVIVYDRLVSVSVLSLCNPNAKMIDVGKMPMHHKVKQSEINKMLVDLAIEFNSGIIARLKGGDPFVFGRGGEEALELVNANIEFEIVPGITSAIAVPAYAGIPVSHRGLATSFYVITGHEMDGGIGLDFKTLAKCSGTLIFLMGVKNMSFIVNSLIECGKAKNTPVAFIENGTTAKQRIVYATLENAQNIMQTQNVCAPAITIMGSVVELGKKLAWQKKLPLSGTSLVVTRSAKQVSTLTNKLTALGAIVIETPMIKTEPLDYAYANNIRADFNDLKNFETLVFTSVNGVESFFALLLKSGLDIRSLANKKIASVGKVTEKKLLEYGLRSDFVPQTHTADGLGKTLCELGCKNVLLIQGNLADDTLIKYLPKAKRWIVYKTLSIDALPDWKLEAVSNANAVVFASSSAVNSFNAIVCNAPKIAFCIGDITAATAKNCGFETIVSDETSVDSLVKKVVEFFA